MVIRVVIVCDVRLYIEGVALLLERSANLEVVALVSDWHAASHEALDHHPDVVLVDVATTRGLATVRALVDSDPLARIVALAISESEPEVIACVEAGAVGYVPRTAAVAELIATIESVARGEAMISPRMVASILRRVKTLAGGVGSGASPAPLTSRELEIANLLTTGLSNKHIASRLNIELSTVKNHVHNILEKLRVHRRGDIAREVRAAPPRRSETDARRGG